MRNRRSIDLYVALTYIFSCSSINPVGIMCIGLQQGDLGARV